MARGEGVQSVWRCASVSRLSLTHCCTGESKYSSTFTARFTPSFSWNIRYLRPLVVRLFLRQVSTKAPRVVRVPDLLEEAQWSSLVHSRARLSVSTPGSLGCQPRAANRPQCQRGLRGRDTHEVQILVSSTQRPLRVSELSACAQCIHYL